MTQIISGIVDIEPTPTALVSAVQLSKSTAPLGTYNFGLFGDSITNNGYYGSTSPSYAWPDDNDNDIIHRDWGWSTWLGPLSHQRAQVVKSWAYQTNGILAAGSAPAGLNLSRQITDALADPEFSKINICAILIGTNDNAFSINSALAELQIQIDRLNKPVVLIAPPAIGPSFAPTTVVGDGMQKWVWFLEWYSRLRQFCVGKPNITFVDGYSVSVDRTSATNNILSTRTYDDIHPNNALAFLICEKVIEALNLPTISQAPVFWPSNNSAATTGTGVLGYLDQGFANPLFSVATGGVAGTGVTGTVAANLTLVQAGAGTAVASVIANPNGLGNMQRMVITSAGAGDGITLTTDSCHAAGGTFLSNGEYAYAQCLVTINAGGILPRGIYMRILGFQSPTNYTRMLFEPSTPQQIALPITTTRTLLLRTPLLRMPLTGSPFNLLFVTLRPQFAASGTCTIDVGNMEIIRVRP